MSSFANEINEPVSLPLVPFQASSFTESAALKNDDFATIKTQPSLTFQQALTMAHKNNLSLKAEQAQLKLAEADSLTASLRPNPSIMSDNGLAEKTYRLGIQHTIELGGKRHKRKHAAQLNEIITQQSVQQAALELTGQVRQAYTALYAAQQQVALYHDQSDLAQTLYHVAIHREHAGDIAQVDVLQAQVAWVQAKTSEQNAGAKLTQARLAFNTLINVPLQTTYQLDAPPVEPIEPTSLEERIYQALSHHPSIQQLNAQLEHSHAQEALFHALNIPNLQITVGPDWVQGDGGGLNAFAIAQVELPIWNRQQGTIEKERAQQHKLQLEKQATEHALTYHITEAHERLLAYQNQQMHYDTEILPLSATLQQKSVASFKAGKSSIVLPINAQQAYVQAKIASLDSLINVQNALTDLEQAIGAITP